MLGNLVLSQILHEKFSILPRKSFKSECDWGLCHSLPWYAALYWSPVAWDIWDVGTGEKRISHFWKTFFRRPTQSCTQTEAPETRCTEYVEDLTSRIVRTDAYPMAFGGFSDVWHCQLQDKQSPPETVAVKAVRPVMASEEEYQVKRKAVEQELNIWFRLQHRNILPLYGIANGFGRLPAFVCPWADNGTLSEYLEIFETELNLKKRMTLLSDIADGLLYLHSRNIMHGDLSGTNILITESGRACLSDFGLSTLFEQVSDTVASDICFPGNIRWAAPELLGKVEEGKEGGPPSQMLSQQADIYSFGSIMLQTLSGKLPFHGIQRVAQIVIMISRGHQPPRELGWDGKDIPDALWKFVEACWASPDQRPLGKDIVSFIKSQLSRL